MKTTLFIYILMGVLFILPLVLFNIRKIWVRRPPDPMKFRPGRFVFILLASAFIVTFLVTAYQQTMLRRYEIAIERAAQQHAEAIVGTRSLDDYRGYLLDNGTETLQESLDATEFPDYGDANEVRFQISKNYLPKYWQEMDEFVKAPVDESGENPIYVMYKLVCNDREDYYVMRLRYDGERWKYEWFGNANEVQIKKIPMPTEKNGKWFTVKG